MKRRRIRTNGPPLDDEPRKRIKDHDLRICTWNVLSLYRLGAKIQLTNVLEKYKADITAIQEIRWLGQGCCETAKHHIYYSCSAEKHEFGCGFVVSKRLRDTVIGFTPVDERLATIRIRAKFFNISLICAHAPTEEKDEGVKDRFYDRLDDIYDRCPKHDVKIVLGDFNAKIGKENVFGPTVGKFSLHDETSENGMRLIDFAAARNMVISSTRFKHLDIHKATWRAPEKQGKITRNQIDHVIIDGRHSSSVLDVRTLRTANIDSDHYLVAAKVRTRLSRSKIIRRDTRRRLNIERLHSQQVAQVYSSRLTELLQGNPQFPTVDGQWAHLSSSIRTAAEEVLGYERPRRRNQWHDQECQDATADKNAAYRATLQQGITQDELNAATQKYREKRKFERSLFRRKKRELERRECEEIEGHYDRNEARKFFKKIKSQTEGFKCGASSCRDDSGNLVTDAQASLSLWKNHFSKLLTGDEADHLSYEDFNARINDDGIDIPPPDYMEVRMAISRLKNNKSAGADGLPAELFKTGGEELVRCIHQLLCRIWCEENMPDEWNLSVLCPIHKKGDPTVCTNYRGISLLSIAYKILSGVICERLKPYTNDLIGKYQCGFRPGKSTIDQIFTLRQLLEKTMERQIDTHHLFVDYKAAFDTPIREKFYVAMSELGIPTKIVRLCSMTLRNTKSAVKIGADLSESFHTDRGFRQGDTLSCDFFNLLMEKILQETKIRTTDIIYDKSVMLLAYADDIDIIGRNTRAVSSAFDKLEKQSRIMGLKVNENKTKYLIASSKTSTRLEQQMHMGDYKFEVVKDFIYLGAAINSDNDVSLEIKRRITLANRCYFGLSKQLRSKVLSRHTKVTLYKTLILPVLMYGAETWTMKKSDESALAVFERKILRKIYGPIRVDDTFRIRMNHELYELYADIDVVKRIKVQRLRWLGHVWRMENNAPARKSYREDPIDGMKRKRGRPKCRWEDQVQKDLKTLGVTNWRQHAEDRNDWRSILIQAQTDTRLY